MIIGSSNYEYNAAILRIVDGDTIYVLCDLGFTLHESIELRLAGINTPEVVGEEKAAGIAARDFVRAALPIGTPIRIKTYKDKKEKYGRYLADVMYTNATGEEILLNKQLIDLGLAKPYEKLTN